ncbi:unnamed protein product [Polarella glacialis]|uniref:RanBP2-type domain-containing protein n=1 Tax=Polarella glacialis TaxID=89957 RepID=A0A813HBL7_POLGL|nr:unnamed protein product [Polarella glacialis]
MQDYPKRFQHELVKFVEDIWYVCAQSSGNYANNLAVLQPDMIINVSSICWVLRKRKLLPADCWADIFPPNMLGSPLKLFVAHCVIQQLSPGFNVPVNMVSFVLQKAEQSAAVRVAATAAAAAQARADFSNSTESRPGDWDCEKCGAYCYAMKLSCFKCGAPNPDGRSLRRTNGVMNPNDWECPKCSAHVFASRDSCFRCGTPKMVAVPRLPPDQPAVPPPPPPPPPPQVAARYRAPARPSAAPNLVVEEFTPRWAPQEPVEPLEDQLQDQEDQLQEEPLEPKVPFQEEEPRVPRKLPRPVQAHPWHEPDDGHWNAKRARR